MPALDAFSHVSLTVSDPERSTDFYNRVLGTETDQRFDPNRIGLDHVAFQVPSRAELEAWRAGLVAGGVICSEIETSPFGLHLDLKDPDNIAIELFVSQPA